MKNHRLLTEDALYNVTRRATILGAAAAAAAAATGPLLASEAKAGPQWMRRKIDVHHHTRSPGLAGPTAQMMAQWTPQGTVEGLDRAGIATALIYPGPLLVGESHERGATVSMWNDRAAMLGAQYPGRFGLLASLPLPYVDHSVREIDRALDELNADGFAVATSYGKIWQGDRALWPIYEKLDQRGAVLYVHPYNAVCCETANFPYQEMLGLSQQAWIEFPMHSARAIFSLMLNGTLRAFPNIKFIFSHGGGLMPLLVGRLEGLSEFVGTSKERHRELFPNGVATEFRKLYFEGAQAYGPANMSALLSLVPDTQLLFGSDYPFFPLAHAAREFEEADLPQSTKFAIARGNAERLFPRWADKLSLHE